jgi:hypothetical protein
LEGLYDLATTSAQHLLTTAKDHTLVPIEILKGDMLEVNWWSTADIVYASSICFPDALVEGIADRCAHLKKGARILTLKNFP